MRPVHCLLLVAAAIATVALSGCTTGGQHSFVDELPVRLAHVSLASQPLARRQDEDARTALS